MNNQSPRTNGNKTTKNRKVFGQWLFFIAIGLFLMLIVRFAYIGIFKDVQNVNLKSRTEKLYAQENVVQAKRGTIYDSSGKAIAEDTNTYTIYAVVDKNQKSTSGKPLYVKNKAKTAQVLAKYLGISTKSALKTLNPSNKNAYQVEFGSAGTGISIATKEKIQAQKLPGIHFIATPAREYPNGTFASQLVGLAQSKTDSKTGSSTLVGQMGIEKVFNTQLSGSNGIKKSKTDTSGYKISSTTSKKVVNGKDIYTTLDDKLQTLLENRMDSAYSGSKAESMTAILMDAKTGKVVASTQRPTFNSDTKDGISKSWRNIILEDTYEPGSTMKVFTLAAAIQTGNFNPNAYYQSGTYQLGGGEIDDWSKSGWGSITYKEGFERSSNVAMAHLEQMMGANTWKKYIKKFGLLKPVNVGLGTEASGSTPFSGKLEQANTSFGQGITVTAIQMMQGFSAIANNGTMVKPYFISKIVNPDTKKTVKTYGKKVTGHPVSASTAKKVRKYMQDVVYAAKGTGGKYKIDGYRIAGKTGTAQIGTSSGYESGSNSYVYSFVGMAPAKNPQYIMYLTIKKPTDTSRSAEDYLADVFKPVMKQALDTRKAENTKTKTAIKVPNLKGTKITSAQKKLQNKGLQVVTLGTGKKVTEQSDDAGTTLLKNGRVFLKTTGQIQMPDMSNWSKADVSRFATFTGLKLATKGSGYVSDQSIKTNTAIKVGQSVTVTFKSK